MAEATLAPHRTDDDQLRLSGPEVTLPAPVARTLGLVLHELTTNAAKYGALSRRGGRVEVRHEVDASGVATVHWAETGGPPLAGPPARRGFGTRLLERGLAQDLGPGSSVELRFEPAGLHAVLRFKAGERSMA